MEKLVFYDLETTGTKFWKNGIHQIAGIIVIGGIIQEEFNFKVRPNPAAEIEEEALKVGNVSLETIMQYPDMGTVHKDLTALLAKYVDKYNSKDKFHLVGYNNAKFDDQFLRAWFVQNHDNYFGSWFWADSIDVMVLASDKLKSVRSTMENFKLRTVAKHLGVEFEEEKLHDALYDIHMTRQVYMKL